MSSQIEAPPETPGRPFRRQVVRNTVASGLSTGWTMLAGLVSVPLLVAGLGPRDFGVWALVMTFSATNGWLSLGDLGVVVATTRQVAAAAAVDDLEGVRRITSAALVAVIGFGIVGGTVLALAGRSVLPTAFGLPTELVAPFAFAMSALGVQVVLDLALSVVEAALEGLQRVDLSRAVESFRRLSFVVGISLGALIGRDLRWVAIGSLAAALVSLTVALVVLHRKLPRFGRRPDAATVVELVKRGRAVAMLRPLGVVQRTMDRTLVGVTLGPGAVALVEVATQLQAAADAVLSASSYAVVPTSAWLRARGDRTSISKLAERGTKYSTLLTVPVAIAVATLAGPFIELWVGDRFADAAGLAAVAALAIIVTAPLAVGSQLLLGLDRTTVILRAAAVALVVNLGVSAVLLHVIGIVGAMWGTVTSAVVLALVMGPQVARAADTTVARMLRVAVVPVIAPAAAQLAVAWALLQIELAPAAQLALVGTGSIGTYVVVAWRTAVERSELADLR